MRSSQRAISGLAFKPHLKAEIVPGEGVYLVSERGVTALRGTGITTLAPLLDGTRSLSRLVADARAIIPEKQAEQVVSHLMTAGLLTDQEPALDPRSAADRAFWELAGLDGATADRRVHNATIGVVGVGQVGATGVDGLCEALAEAGLHAYPQPTLVAGRADEGTSVPDLTIAVCGDYLDPSLREADAVQRRTGVPWLLVRLVGDQPCIGPIFRPGEGPCWHCLAHLLRRNRPAEIYLGQVLGRRVSTPTSCLSAGHAMGLRLAALEAAKWLAGHRHPGQDAVWTFDALTLIGRHHPVRRRPQCTGCGDPELVARRVTAPLSLGKKAKTATGCGERWMTPQQMLERYGHLIDPVTGVVKEVRRDDRGPDFLNCFHAGHNPATSPTGLDSLRDCLRGHSSGKGTTELHARVSALCEAVERYSGYFHGDEPTFRAAYHDIADAAIHPDTVQLFHPRQYADRERWNAEHPPAHWVCEPLDVSVPLNWTPVWSLTERRHRLLPTSLLYYNPPRGADTRFCSANSNGSAAGSCLEDALVQGFLELVERDAVGLWWYNRTRHAAVDLDAFDDPWVNGVRSGHAGLRRELWVLDLTSDLGIPVFAALSRRTDKQAEDITLGFGAHFDPRTALRRSVAELNQMLPPVAEVQADGTGYTCEDPAALSWWRTARVADHPYTVPDPTLPAVVPSDFSHTHRPDLSEDVAAIEALVRRKGLELLVLNQTRPDVELPVVKVIVPGLRTFWTRFGAGRLYDVPVQLGRLAAPTRYEDLNPIPLFL